MRMALMAIEPRTSPDDASTLQEGSRHEIHDHAFARASPRRAAAAACTAAVPAGAASSTIFSGTTPTSDFRSAAAMPMSNTTTTAQSTDRPQTPVWAIFRWRRNSSMPMAAIFIWRGIRRCLAPARCFTPAPIPTEIRIHGTAKAIWARMRKPFLSTAWMAHSPDRARGARFLPRLSY